MERPTSWATRARVARSSPGHDSQDRNQEDLPLETARTPRAPRNPPPAGRPLVDRENPGRGHETPKGLSINVAKLDNSGVTVAKIRGLPEGRLDSAATKLISDDLFRLVCDPAGSTLILDLSQVRAMSGHFVELMSALVIRMRYQARRFIVCGAHKDCAQMFWNARLRVEFLPSVNHFFGCYWLEHLARMTDQGWCVSSPAAADWDA